MGPSKGGSQTRVLLAAIHAGKTKSDLWITIHNTLCSISEVHKHTLEC